MLAQLDDWTPDRIWDAVKKWHSENPYLTLPDTPDACDARDEADMLRLLGKPYVEPPEFRRDITLKEIAAALREKITGHTHTPPINEVMSVFGKDECLSRLLN